jgi:hypothetical protein
MVCIVSSKKKAPARETGVRSHLCSGTGALIHAFSRSVHRFHLPPSGVRARRDFRMSAAGALPPRGAVHPALFAVSKDNGLASFSQY